MTPLTPSHFLIGRPNGFQPNVSLEESDLVTGNDLSDREKHRLQLLDSFWSVWSRDYLCNLPPALNRFRKLGNLGVGHIVLIKEDHVPRMLWHLGLVLKVFPGIDGIVRSVLVKTVKGEYVRSIQCLYDLEVQQSSIIVPTTAWNFCDLESIGIMPDPVDSIGVEEFQQNHTLL